MDQHPLSTALSPLLPISPSFIYLHHPYHSSGYALPAEMTGFGEESQAQRGAQPGQMNTLTVKVDLSALNAAETSSQPSKLLAEPVLSQKLFYNSVIRTTCITIQRNIALRKSRWNHDLEGDQNTPHKTKNPKRKPKGTVDPFDAAVSAFEDTYVPLAEKDVYRWDVFVTRLRGMADGFAAIVAAGQTVDEREEASGITFTLVVLESQLLQKCLGATWHALLRLNEMVRHTAKVGSMSLISFSL